MDINSGSKTIHHQSPCTQLKLLLQFTCLCFVFHLLSPLAYKSLTFHLIRKRQSFKNMNTLFQTLPFLPSNTNSCELVNPFSLLDQFPQFYCNNTSFQAQYFAPNPSLETNISLEYDNPAVLEGIGAVVGERVLYGKPVTTIGKKHYIKYKIMSCYVVWKIFEVCQPSHSE